MNKPTLSIYVATYNHEQYIEKALDSIFMQKTKYSYEVLVGEDASTDNTRNVLKEFEKKHNYGNLLVFYREKNMSNFEISNGRDLINKCRGKYIIALEGDDYWIDENKIEKQISILEQNDNILAVSHKCVVVDENGNKKNEKYPECQREFYSIWDYINGILPGQLTTVMYRNFRSRNIGIKELRTRNGPGDRALYFTLLLNGNVLCLNEKMSAYRHVTSGGSSYSANHKYNFEKEEKYHKEFINYAKQNQKKIFIIVTKLDYIANVLYAKRHKMIDKKQKIDYLQSIGFNPFYFILYIVRGITRGIILWKRKLF